MQQAFILRKSQVVENIYGVY